MTGPRVAAALVTGGRIRVPGWPQHTTQAGDEIRDILDVMGAEVRLARDGLTVSAVDGFGGVDLDLHDASELTRRVMVNGSAAMIDAIVGMVAAEAEALRENPEEPLARQLAKGVDTSRPRGWFRAAARARRRHDGGGRSTPPKER